MFDKLNGIKIFGFNIYFFITFLFVIIIYMIYSFIKKYKVIYLKIMLLCNIVIFSIILFLLIKYDIKEDRIKSGCLSIILVCIFMLFRAKHDNRGKNINYKINNQNIWKKTYVYFFPQEFNDEELKIIENILGQIFDTLKSRGYEKRIGESFFWIKKKKGNVSIKLVNQLDYSCEDISNNIIKAYKDIEESTNFKLTISGKRDAKIELFMGHQGAK